MKSDMEKVSDSLIDMTNKVRELNELTRNEKWGWFVVKENLFRINRQTGETFVSIDNKWKLLEECSAEK